MKLGRLLLLAGAALAANQFLKTERGRQLKRDLTDKAKGWKDQLSAGMNGRSDSMDHSGPAGNSFSGGNGPSAL